MTNTESFMQFPNYIDTRKAFDQGMSFQGRVDKKRLLRLVEIMAQPGRLEVDASLQVFRDDNNFRRISGAVKGVISVYCQRCLNPLVLKIHDDINLVLLESEGELTNLESGLDPWIIDGTYLDPSEIIEEQVLLSMPIVSFHDEGECSNEIIDGIIMEDSDRELKENPFDVLKTLL
jgi:uncharacterized protein